MVISYEDVLQNTFGLKEFRRGQREILTSILNGRDVLAVLPTGGGKSLCYQLPAVLLGKLVIVISPLIALMNDQVASLKKRGIPAGCLHSGQTMDEKRAVFQNLAQASSFVLYLSPERAAKPGFQDWLKNRDIGLFAIDEAHCVSQWGHDFRKEYTELKILKALRPDVPTLALTASATPLVLSDIARHLHLNQPERHVYGFYRPNLYYQVQPCANGHEKMSYVFQSLAQNPTGRVIIYCGTRKTTEAVSETLSQNFAGVARYHAGLGTAERTQIQNDYERGATRILVSTNAFGMGVDHPDVRLVIHYNMPANIDSLYQEMGRAGRDGRDSTCLLLFEKKDKGLQAFFIESSDAPPEIKRVRWNTLNALLDYAESTECRHGEILAYYKDSQRLRHCGHCDVCLPASPRKIAEPELKLPVDDKVVVKKKAKTKMKAQVFDMPLNEIEDLRFQMLREWRKRKADELDVAAFVIFSDKTLREIARKNPASKAELEHIHGFGEVKLDRFGGEVLMVLGET